MTVAPRAAASGASWRETSRPAEKSAMSTPSKASGVASPTVRVRPSALTVDPGGATGGEQAQLADREVPFGQDLDHRSTDDAGGADDRDGQRAGFSRTWLHSMRAGLGRGEYTSGAPKAGAAA